MSYYQQQPSAPPQPPPSVPNISISNNQYNNGNGNNSQYNNGNGNNNQYNNGNGNNNQYNYGNGNNNQFNYNNQYSVYGNPPQPQPPPNYPNSSGGKSVNTTGTCNCCTGSDSCCSFLSCFCCGHGNKR